MATAAEPLLGVDLCSHALHFADLCSHTLVGSGGRLVVCISASAEPREFYERFADMVADTGHRCLYYDSFGRGATPLPPDGVVSLDAEIELLLALIDEKAPGEPCALVAHSAGGVLALHFAARHPERVAALALFCVLGAPHEPELAGKLSFIRRLVSTPCVGPHLYLSIISRTHAKSHRHAAIQYDDPEDGERVVRLFARMAARPECRDAFAQILTRSPGGTSQPVEPAVLKEVAASPRPVLLAHARDDATLPTRQTDALAAAFDPRHATTLLLDSGAHCFPRSPALLRPGGALREAFEQLMAKIV